MFRDADVLARQRAATVTFTLAMRRGLVGTNPCSLLTRDERPARKESEEVHIWSDAEIPPFSIPLRAWLVSRSPGMFVSRKGTPLSHRNVQARGFAPAAKLAEIEGVSFHDLRHASRIIARGITSPELAAVMAHESAAVTEHRYISLSGSSARTTGSVRPCRSSWTCQASCQSTGWGANQ